MSTLVEKAKEVKATRKRNYVPNEEEIDLALAYVNQEITGRQLCNVMGYKGVGGSKLYTFVALTLQHALVRKKISITREKL